MTEIENVQEQAIRLITIAYDMGLGAGESTRPDVMPVVIELRRAIKDVVQVMTESKSFHDNAPILIGLRKLLIDTDPESAAFKSNAVYVRPDQT